MDLSIVVPIHNELENIALLHQQVTAALDPTGLDYELILVDDGSRDGSALRLQDLAHEDQRVRVVELRKNFGQSAAMLAGIRECRGTYVVTMDGDLQNDPTDIPRMLAKLGEGYDLVHGWRRERKDRWLDRKLPSQLANKLITRVTRFRVHDLGCTLKAMRREVAQELDLYGEMHRFIPILADMRGAKCVEVEVKHHPRLFGKTKYGIDRTVRVFLDLITVTYLKRYAASPMKLFGRWGLMALAVTMLLFMAAAVQGIWHQTANVPLIVGGLLMGGLAGQFFSLGLLAEVACRIYFAGRDESVYAVRHRWGFGEKNAVSREQAKHWRKAG
ncbi:Undecaprenyl-phosphate 4-deoxy-4-formamido-L-arabinose transferase [Anatilimnocola aggregata]|uniref:Undecaprenyl-phosphate 4-deoxy-4-formamido-L-arabinose transferase n=1 Tax=Anatilimnocola aggregata TaxID=2528021 RepID=A0A517YBZ7_9BACT|nr:glycosyltransferase family 2 protein [Anatilimnocola aggregata]QDU27642.1 Undecaprenyl-phosphate 4-deoxy-4-formamido-L-arabinose transferase [Anatilimnocola aggregata]